MPDGGIVVDYNTINTAATDCGETVKKLNGAFEDLKGGLKPLVDSWDGGAKEAYLQLQQQWDQSFDDLSQLLAQVAAVLPQIADGYQGTEQGVTNLMGGGA